MDPLIRPLGVLKDCPADREKHSHSRYVVRRGLQLHESSVGTMPKSECPKVKLIQWCAGRLQLR